MVLSCNISAVAISAATVVAQSFYPTNIKIKIFGLCLSFIVSFKDDVFDRPEKPSFPTILISVFSLRIYSVIMFLFKSYSSSL